MQRRCAMLLLLLFLAGPTAAQKRTGNAFQLGAVLAGSGRVRAMADARKGYELGVTVVNNANAHRGFRILDTNSVPHYFKLQFRALDDESDADKHNALVRSLLDGDADHPSVDFLLGSHPEFAWEETRLAGESRTLNLQCCVGPDQIYEQGIPYVFGISVSNTRYPWLAMHSMLLRDIRRIGILRLTDNLFTDTTCLAAIQNMEQAEWVDTANLRVSMGYTAEQGNSMEVFEEFVRESEKQGVEGVVACSLADDGGRLVDAFYNAGKSLKAFFLTVGPSRPSWVEQYGNKTDYLLSAAQWHTGLSYSDAWFGTSKRYAEKFEREHGEGDTPTYVAAMASATILTAVHSLQDAFQSCDLSLTGGDVYQILYNSSAIDCGLGSANITGYQKVQQALSQLDIKTFAGRVKFNLFRRNVGNDPATTQVLPRKGNRDVYAVLPVRAANAQLVMPAKNAFKPSCSVGFYVGQDDFSPCMPCEPGQASSYANANHCDRCPVGQYNPKFQQQDCENCPPGTTTAEKGTARIEDCHCLAGYYNTEGKGGLPCKPCPSGAVCSGGIELPVPMFGHWMNATYRDVSHQCDPENACIGGPDLECEEGHTGRMCSECSEGHFGVIDSCMKCPPKSAVVVFILFVVLGWYVLNVVISKSVSSLEIMLNWAQLANVIGDVDLRWPGRLGKMFSIANVLDFDVDILEPSCLLNWSFTHNFMVQLLLPFFMSLLAYMGYVAASFALQLNQTSFLKNRDRLRWWIGMLVSVPHDKQDLSAKWDATIAAFLSSVEVTYITIAKYCFDVFKCENIGGVSVLRTDPSIECNTRQHSLLIAFGIVGTLSYSVGYLCFVSWKLWRINLTRSFQDLRNLRRYGFLYRTFELDYFWSPIVVLARRLLFVMILVFINNPGFQAGSMVIIVTGSLMLHIYTAPYVDTYLDVLFSFLLIALMFEAFSGVLFYSSNLPNQNRIILEWIVLGALFMLVLIFIVIFSLEIVRIFQLKFLKGMHFRDTLKRANLEPTGFSNDLREIRETKREMNDELLQTFDSNFIYTALKSCPERMSQWDKLNYLLKDYMSDQAECSYLSREPIAKFWRKLVDRFPELVDFLAVASDDSRVHFRHFATTMYKDFYLTNKVKRLPILSVLNWKDRAPMAQWLARASNEDRRFFTTVMSDMFKYVDEDLGKLLDKQVESRGTVASAYLMGLSTSVSRSRYLKWPRSASGSGQMVMNEIQSGRTPLEFRRSSTLRATDPGSISSQSSDLESPTIQKIHELPETKNVKQDENS